MHPLNRQTFNKVFVFFATLQWKGVKVNGRDCFGGWEWEEDVPV